MKRRFLLFLALTSGVFVCCHAQWIESSLSYRRFTTQDGLPQMQTETVWQDSRGYIYIGTLSGFVRFDGRSLTTFLRGRRENIVGFQEVGDEVWAMGFVRQWRMKGDGHRSPPAVTMVPTDPEGAMLLNNLNAADLPPGYVLIEDRQETNRMICRTCDPRHQPSGIIRPASEVFRSPLLDDMTPDRKLYIDSSSVYVPTSGGLFRLREGRTAQLLTARDDIFSLIRTADGLLALGKDGLYTVGEDSLACLSRHHFEAPDYGLAVRQIGEGRLVVADAHTIWLYDGGWRQMATGFKLIRSLFVDKWNRLWVASYQGVFCFFHCDFVNHRLTDRNDLVRAICFDAEGHAVMGTLNGRVFRDGQLADETEGNFFAPSAVRVGDCVYMAGFGDVAAVGLDGGVRWVGLPYDKYQFVSRYADRLIIGTRSSVLSFNPSTLRTDTLASGIVRPWCAADDGQGRLWVSANSGLYCLTNVDGGMVGMEKVKNTPSALVISALSSDARGHTCFAVGDTLFAILGGEIRPMTEAMPTLRGHEIRSVHVSPKGYVVVAAIDGLMVARLGDTLTDIHWFDARTGFTMIEPLAATMAEADDGTVWMAGLEEMTSFSPELLLSDNQESTVIAAPRPWWQQGWALCAGGVLLSLLVWMVTRVIVQVQTRKKMERLSREKEQKELQLSAIRLKSIPHFHANVLASIEYFVANRFPSEASHYLKLYSDFTNQTLSDIDRPSRTVADEVDYVRSYLELEHLRYGDRLRYAIDVSPDVNLNVMLPTMVLHTYCQNAVKHGIAGKAEGGSVTVSVSRQQRGDGDGVLVTVSDDGVGRTEAAHLTGSSTKQGLKILSQQIALYNRSNRKKIVQRVIDLTDDDGRPSGTCFELWVPADYTFC